MCVGGFIDSAAAPQLLATAIRGNVVWGIGPLQSLVELWLVRSIGGGVRFDIAKFSAV